MQIVRTAVVYDPKVKALPVEFRSVLTKQDRKAIQIGSKYFATLAKPESPKWLRKLLESCSESDYELQFHAQDDSPYTPYFRFMWQGEPAISLPRPAKARSDIPGFLREIYRVIGSFVENDFSMAGGLVSIDDLEPVSETWMWVEPGGPIDPAKAVGFLQKFSGSLLCYLPDGSGAWLESCHFRKVKNLARG